MVVPEFRAGDTVFPGRPVAEVLHESGIELVAKVSEYDRAHLNAGQKADVAIHAVQGKNLPATIKSVAGASRREVWAWNDPTRTFDVSFDVTGSNPASLRPGLTTQVRVTGAPIKDRCTFRVRRSSNTTASPWCSCVKAGRSSRARSSCRIEPKRTLS